MAENWPKLAEAIGMVRIKYDGKSYWVEAGGRADPEAGPIDLPAYLMEPAQTARILKADLPGAWWRIENSEGLWIVYRLHKNKRVLAAYGKADKEFGEAVARCAARCLA